MAIVESRVDLPRMWASLLLIQYIMCSERGVSQEMVLNIHFLFRLHFYETTCMHMALFVWLGTILSYTRLVHVSWL